MTEKVLKHKLPTGVGKFAVSFERPCGPVRFAEKALGERWYRVAEFYPTAGYVRDEVVLDFLPNPRIAEEIAHFTNIGAFAVR